MILKFSQQFINIGFFLQFQEILKPNYNSVDLTEVELVDTYNPEPRGNDTQLLAVSVLFWHTWPELFSNFKK